jgi:iron complex outermembrane receptor protein
MLESVFLRVRTFLTASCLVVFGVTAAWSQPTGQLSGVVRDTMGGVLPGVEVSVTSVGGVTPRTSLTDGQGRYEVDALLPGRHTVEASLGGFQPKASDVDIDGGRATLDLVLSVSTVLEKVTVTATKTGTADIQTTPIAVTALPERTLEQLGVNTVEGLAGFVPSLTVSHFAGLAQVSIRGIGTNGLIPGADPSSTIHLDGVYLARPAMLFMDFLNVERVEVLRGPQGTLYGRNSVGGTINIVSRQPTNTLEGMARLTAGSHDKLRAEAAVSGPLVKDKVMANFAVIRDTRDGFVQDVDHPDHPLGSVDNWAGRGQVRVVFGSRNELLVSADYGRFDGVPVMEAKPILAKPGFSFDNPDGLWAVRTSDLTSGQNTQKGASAKLTVQLNRTTTLNSLTAYRTSHQRSFMDTDGTELQLQASDIPDVQHQISEELTVMQRLPKLTWIGGAFLFDEDVDAEVRITVYPAIQLRPFSTNRANARALFGQATFDVSRRVSLTGGARYTTERKDLHATGGVYVLGTDIVADPRSVRVFDGRATFQAWTPKGGVQMQVSDDTFAYVSAARGFKSGGFNPGTPGETVTPEFAWTYEGGVKRMIAGGRARVNTAVFYTDYQDLQVLSFLRPGVPNISNAASAGITGVEVEAAASAWRGVQLAGSVSWLDATYDRYRAVGPGGVTGDAAGHRLNNAPEWSGSGSAAFEFATGRAGFASVRCSVSGQSRVFFTPFNTNIETQAPYALVHLRAGFEPHHRRWELSVFVRNLANQEYLTSTANVPLPAFTGQPGEPRMWGTQFTLRR